MNQEYHPHFRIDYLQIAHLVEKNLAEGLKQLYKLDDSHKAHPKCKCPRQLAAKILNLKSKSADADMQRSVLILSSHTNSATKG